jgi:hypothetical protein
MTAVHAKLFVSMHQTTQTVEWFRDAKAMDRDDLADLQANLPQREHLISRYGKFALELACNANGYNHFHPGKEDYAAIVYGLRRAARVVASECELSQPGGVPVAVERDPEVGGPVLIDSPRQFAHLGKYIDAVWCAVIVRDDDTLHRLATINLADVRGEGVTISEGMSALAHALQAWLRKTPDAAKQALGVLKLTGPAQQHPPGTMNYAVMCINPAAELLLLLQSPAQPAETIAHALAQALEAHKQYYTLAEDTPGGAGESDDQRSFLCLHALAFACVLNDRGVEVAVESDYLPRPIVTGSAPDLPLAKK